MALPVAAADPPPLHRILDGENQNVTPRAQSQNGTPRSSQKQNGTVASQRSRKGTPASQKKGSQKGDSLPKGPGWVKKRKGWKAETAI